MKDVEIHVESMDDKTSELASRIKYIDVDWQELPSSMSNLKLLAGEEGAFRLIETYNGESIYIPIEPKASHPIVRLLGEKKARELSAVYGGGRLHVPKKDAIMRQVRMRSIVEARKSGASITDLAREHNLTARRVLQILAVIREKNNRVQEGTELEMASPGNEEVHGSFTGRRPR